MNMKELLDKLKKLDSDIKIKGLDSDLEVFIINSFDGNTHEVVDVGLSEVYDNDEGDIARLRVGTKVLALFFKHAEPRPRG